jgi:REP element-mobilizing transposase RayT
VGARTAPIAVFMDEPIKHRRHSLRLKGYDYAQAGAYFITLCAHDRACLFGEVIDGSMRLNAVGQLAATLWNDMPARFTQADLDLFVVMPNHLHGIIVLFDRAAPRTGAPRSRAAAPTVGDIVGAFKSLFVVRYAEGVKHGRWPPFNPRLWQRNYYEHVIRDESELARIRRYIEENPLRWELDDENPLRAIRGARQQGGHKGRPYATDF